MRLAALEDARHSVDERIASLRELEDRIASMEGLSGITGLADATASMRQLNRAERRWREHLLDNLGQIVAYVGVNLQVTVYFFDPRDTKSGQTFFIEQSVRRDQAQLRRAVDLLDSVGALPNRDLFLDVGAHIGTTTIYAVRHLSFAGALAIEPAVENVLLLRLSTVANGIDHMVRVVQAAVSDETAVAVMDVGGAGSEYHRIEVAAEPPLARLVPTMTLDQLVADGSLDPDRLSLVWMDIEGYEGNALLGASRLLANRVPIVMEACPKKLERAGMLHRIREIVSGHYTHVYDLRSQKDSATFRPVEEIDDLIDGYGQHCTDLLLCSPDRNV